MDWGHNGILLVSMKNEVYILDPFKPQKLLKVTVSAEHQVIAVKWIGSTTYDYHEDYIPSDSYAVSTPDPN